MTFTEIRGILKTFYILTFRRLIIYKKKSLLRGVFIFFLNSYFNNPKCCSCCPRYLKVPLFNVSLVYVSS